MASPFLLHTWLSRGGLLTASYLFLVQKNGGPNHLHKYNVLPCFFIFSDFRPLYNDPSSYVADTAPSHDPCCPWPLSWSLLPLSNLMIPAALAHLMNPDVPDPSHGPCIPWPLSWSLMPWPLSWSPLTFSPLMIPVFCDYFLMTLTIMCPMVPLFLSYGPCSLWWLPNDHYHRVTHTTILLS